MPQDTQPPLSSPEDLPRSLIGTTAPLPNLLHLPVVESRSVPRGTPEFEAKKEALLQDFAAKIPIEYRLHPELIRNPPTDVSQIPSTCGILSDEEVVITEEYDAVGLVGAIASRKHTSVAVINAFSKRAIIAHQLTCCLTQWFMEDAIAQATKLDAYLAEHGKPVGPLHGLPVSIKEHMHIAGTFSSLGCFASIVKDQEDCDIVAALRKLGAVFYCKTNQPQSMMHLETDSHWGRVLNPYNIHLSAGGSSGGEAALIAMKGSVLGIGTDIGGSIRAPSAFCGIYGFKPTSSILPIKGFITGPAPPAVLNIPLSTGPMCRTLRDMDLCMRSLRYCNIDEWDLSLAPMEWTGLRTPWTRKLKIGLITHDGFIEPQPPVKRAISWVEEILSGDQYADLVEIKRFTVSGAEDAWSSIKKMYWPDGGKLTIDGILAEGEPIHPLTNWIYHSERQSGMLTAAEIALLRHTRDTFRDAFAESWRVQDVDVVIGPAFVGPACSHDTALYWTYTSLYNMVDYPAVVFPTPIKSRYGETYSETYHPLSDACREVKAFWDEGNFDNAPVNLQLVAPRYRDNQLFGALQLLQGLLSLP